MFQDETPIFGHVAGYKLMKRHAFITFSQYLYTILYSTNYLDQRCVLSVFTCEAVIHQRIQKETMNSMIMITYSQLLKSTLCELNKVCLDTSKLRSLIIVIFTTSYRKVKTDILHCSLDENISLNMQSQSKEPLHIRPMYKCSMCKISLPKPKQILYGMFKLSNISHIIFRTYFHNVKIF